MPSSLTHYWFARDVVNKYKSELSFLQNDTYKYLTYVGAQGPDVLFFYGMVPWVKRKDDKVLQGLGHNLHQDGDGEKFIKMAEYISSLDKKEQEPLIAYLFGAMLHYCLDRRAHSFVFYRTGFQKEGEPEYHYSSDHAIYEAYIDTALLDYYHTSPYKTKSYVCVSADDDLMKKVSEMYSYKEELLSKESFYNAWKDMVLAEKVLLDRSHIKRAALRILGMRHSIVYALVHKQKLPKDGIDYLNTNHEVWYNPANKQKHNESFLEIYESAVDETETIVKLVKKVMSGKPCSKEIREFAGGTTYDGINKNESMKYFDSVYKKGEEK